MNKAAKACFSKASSGALLALLSIMPSVAQASSLIGSTATATVDYPILGDAASYSDTQTIGSGIEFPSGSLQLLPSFGGLYIVGSDINVGSDTIDIQYTQSAYSISAPFNGTVFDFGSSSPAITNAWLDPASSFTASQVVVGFGQNEVTVNVEGLYIASGSNILIDLDLGPSSSTPEPSALGFMVVGLGLLGLIFKRLYTRHAAL